MFLKKSKSKSTSTFSTTCKNFLWFDFFSNCWTKISDNFHLKFFSSENFPDRMKTGKGRRSSASVPPVWVWGQNLQRGSWAASILGKWPAENCEAARQTAAMTAGQVLGPGRSTLWSVLRYPPSAFVKSWNYLMFFLLIPCVTRLLKQLF